MTRSFFILPLLLFLCANAISQTARPPVTPAKPVTPGKATKSDVTYAPRAGELFPDPNAAWNYYLRNVEKKESRDPFIDSIKRSYPPKTAEGAVASRADETNNTIAKGQQYDSNVFDGSYPPDNDIAVSTNGWVVTVVNSSVRFYSASGNLMGQPMSFETFLDDPSLNDDIFDPKILYDSGSNRFFFCVLHGSSPSTSKVLLMFSKTENPQDGWNYYKISMSEHAPSRWADYPNIGVSNNEVYVTVNLFSNSGEYDKVGLFQINKNDGYNNASTVQYQYWTDFADDDGAEPFTLMPVSYGHDGNYGPGIYLVASWVSNAGTFSRVQVFDLTNDINASNETINGYHADVPSFTLGSNAVQPQGDDLDIGDFRMKDAFYLNGVIHCAYTVRFNSAGYNGINYHRIPVSNLSASTQLFGQAGTDLGYPSIASFSGSATDPTVVVYYEYSSSTQNPGCRAVICDAGMNFGTPIEIRSGDTFIDVEPSAGETERWGDYSGASRKPGTAVPTVWVFGIYGKTGSQFGRYGNNVCELRNDAVSDVPITPTPTDLTSVVYPNPAHEYFTLRFHSDRDQNADINLYDAAGKKVKHLGNRLLREGAYQLGFASSELPAGLYIVKVESDQRIVAHEKVVVQ